MTELATTEDGQAVYVLSSVSSVSSVVERFR